MTTRSVPLTTAIAVAVAGGVTVALLVVGGLAATGHRGSPATAGSVISTAVDATTTSGPAGTATTSSGEVVRTVTVQGTGTVEGTPDLLTLNLGVQVQASKATAALDGANQKAQALIDTLVAAGVAKADIATSNLSVWPDMAYPANKITGYTASNTVTAKLRQIDKAGAVIDAAASSVGDAITLGGISLSIDDTSALSAKARDLAVQQAHAQADQLAKAAGVSVGKVVSISEVAQAVSPVYYGGKADTAAGSASPVPIQPGTQTVELQVTVVYELVA